MKQRIALIVSITLFFASSCSKDKPADPPATMAAKIQHKWIFESVSVYANSDLTGPSFFGMAGNGTDFFTFSSNGKLYSLMLGSYDSANYRLQPDSIMYTNTYHGGVASTTTDTISIRVLSDNQLILVSKNAASEYGKFIFKK